MLTVLIEAGDDAEALAHTLASLVSAAVEGLVREVIVLAHAASDDAVTVADHAGCIILQGDLAAGLARAKGDWLLLLEPGARLGEGWTDAVRAHVETSIKPARFSRSRAGRKPLMARLFGKTRPLEPGLLIQKHQARAKKVRSAPELARGLRTTRLSWEITPAIR